MVEVALRTNGLTKIYAGRRGHASTMALVDVSLDVERGTTFGIVGESGCGKSTFARLLVGLEAPTSGSLTLDGQEIRAGHRRGNRALARQIQLVFQDPFSSLDPRITVGRAVDEVLRVHSLHLASRQARVGELLAMVGLAPRFAQRYPHELSGGQAQRVAIARALAVEPRVLVLDEPTSALDVSVRAEIINLLVQLQDALGLTYVFISHDLSMVRHISDEIAVMYLGRVVELGRYDRVLTTPLHPYTVALERAIPIADPIVERQRQRHLDETPAALEVNTTSEGCPYATRCPLVEEQCRTSRPILTPKHDGHLVACHVALRS